MTATTTADFLALGDHAPQLWTKVPRVPAPSPLKGRPIVELPDQGGVATMSRPSSLGELVTDSTGLEYWKRRLAVLGACTSEEIVLAVCAHHQDKDVMNSLVEQALERADAYAAATTGTALHDLCDQYDAGQTPYVPPQFRADVDAYLHATNSFEIVASEEFCVNDKRAAAGTPDRIYRLKRDLRLPDKYAPHKARRVIPKGTAVVGDLKTGQKLEYGHVKWSIAMKIYQEGQRYTLNTARIHRFRYGQVDMEVPGGDRSPWLPNGEQVDPSDGLIIYMPSRGGSAEVRPIDLDRGGQLLERALQVREDRKAKTIGKAIDVTITWADQIDGATGLDVLRQVWIACVEAGEITDELKVAMTAKSKELAA